MKFLGLDIRREQPVIRAGDNFAARTALNQALDAISTVKAATIHLPTLDVATNQNVPANFGYTGDLEDRAIRSDPREMWYLAINGKITPAQAENIMRAGLGGDIWQKFMLERLLESKWPTFRMAFHQLREAVSYTKFNVIPHAEEGEEPTKEAKERAGLVSRAIKSMNPHPYSDEKGFSGMVYDLCNAFMLGVGMTEIIWEKRRTSHGMEMLPRAAAFVHPRHYTFTYNGEFAVFDSDPNYDFDDPRGKANPPKRHTVPDQDKFICAQFSGSSGSSLTSGMMDPIVWLAVARVWCNEWALNTAKNFGSPFIDIVYRPGQSEQEERNKLAQFLKNAGAERRLIHPEGTLATIHPAQSLGSDNPQRYILEESDKQCLFLILGQAGTTVQTPGKLGDSGTHQDTKEERVAGLASWVARNPLRQFARAILRQNYGNDDMCPEIIPDRTRPLGSAEVSTLVSSINASGMPVRADELYKKIGFSQPEPGDIIVQRGEVIEMLTEEEKYEQQMEQQQAQMEMQQQGQEPVAGSQRVQPFDIAAVLHRCTPDQLREIEDMVTAAEKATHLNGEADLLQRHLRKIYDGQEAVKAKGHTHENRR